MEENIYLSTFENKHRKYAGIFKSCDTDNDGFICRRELYNFVKKNCSSNVISKNKVRRFLQLVDRGGDGRLDLNDFINLMERNDFQEMLSNKVDWYINYLLPQPPTIEQMGYEDGEAENSRKQLLHEYSTYRPPIFSILISLTQLCCFITDKITEESSTLSGNGVAAKFFIYDPQRKHEIWRYFTYVFVHVGYTHIIICLSIQILLGIPLEMVHRWWKVFVVYFAGVIFGSLSFSMTGIDMKLAGAAGGVYSLITAHLANVIGNWRMMAYPIVQILVYGIFIIFDFGVTIYDSFDKDVAPIWISLSVYGAGSIAGLFFGICMLRILRGSRFRSCRA